VSLRRDLEALYNARIRQDTTIQEILSGRTYGRPEDALRAIVAGMRVLGEMIFACADVIDEMKEGEEDIM
jgi:hypothetical protein